MSHKKEKTLWIIICVMLLTIGVVFAFYSSRILKNNSVYAKSADEALVGKVTINGEVKFDTKEIGFDIYPGYKGIQMFTLSPTENGDGIYELDLVSNVSSELLSHVKVGLYKTSDTANNFMYRNEEVTLVDDVVVSRNDVITIEGVLEKIYEGELNNGVAALEKVNFSVQDESFVNPQVLPDDEYTYYLLYEYNSDEPFNNEDYDFNTEVVLKHVYSLGGD